MNSFPYRLLPIAILSVLAGILLSCKTLPEVNAASPKPASAILIRDDDKSIEQRSIKSVSREIADKNGEFLQKHLSAIAQAGEPLPINDNEVRLLVDGPQTYDEVFRAIKSAKNNINLEIYIFEDDELGEKLKNLLVEKQHEGLHVKVIYDSLGCISTPKEFFQQMIDAGIQVAEFNPVNPADGKILNLNNRDHRKLLIVDGNIAFTGGINVSAVYSKGSAQILKGSGGNDKKGLGKGEKGLDRGWRDTQIELRGPAVAEMQRIFFKTWNSLTHEGIAPDDLPEKILGAAQTERQNQHFPQYYPGLKKAGDKIVRVVPSNSDDNNNVIYGDFVTAIKTAQHDIHITMAYFSPDDQILDSLCAAAKRRVDVELVLPGFSDIWLIFEAGRWHYGRLLKCGVKIYERHDALLHAKTVVIDGVWSTVGSSNMDMRSFLHNNELNVVVLGSDFGSQMEALFQRDIQHSKAVTRESWRHRPVFNRMRQWIANIFSYWL